MEFLKGILSRSRAEPDESPPPCDEQELSVQDLLHRVQKETGFFRTKLAESEKTADYDLLEVENQASDPEPIEIAPSAPSYPVSVTQFELAWFDFTLVFTLKACDQLLIRRYS